MSKLRHGTTGFSLLEVLLVLAIMTTVMVGILSYTTQKSDEMRRDRTVMQVEQILNAGLAYYVNLGSWPTSLTQLQPNFLPNGTIINSWGQVPSVGAPDVSPSNPGALFYVCTTLTGQQAYAAATTIAGRLPIASAVDGAVTTCPPATTTKPCSAETSTSCTVISSVNIPGQNLNNARSINFAGLYHNGACVAAPFCPSSMVPTIVVAPVSVSGMYDNNSTNVYPISSFTAYAIGTNNTADSPPGKSPLNCDGTASSVGCGLSPNANANYWRVCLRIVTQKGLISKGNGNQNWAQDAGIILALTRCMPPDEPTLQDVSGSPFTVFIND